MIILDGGIGGEMNLRGSCNAELVWSAHHHHHNPDMLREVYKDFIEHGAQMLSANTYSLLKYLLKVEDNEVKASVAEAVNILHHLKDSYKHIMIAGCVSAHDCTDQSDEDIRESILLLTSSIAQASVDCILVEMVQSRHVGKIMVEAADTANIPLNIGFSVVRVGTDLKFKQDGSAFTGEAILSMVRNASNVCRIGVMHSDVEVIDEALSIIECVWPGKMIAYPDSGTFVQNVWKIHATDVETDKIAQSLVECVCKHPRLDVVGGCCGLGPSFTERLCKRLRSQSLL